MKFISGKLYEFIGSYGFSLASVIVGEGPIIGERGDLFLFIEKRRGEEYGYKEGVEVGLFLSPCGKLGVRSMAYLQAINLVERKDCCCY